jgi:threonine/homoserine/homoserine lactone efflux protein
MTALLSILTIASVHYLAVISPGPNFLIVTRSALGSSRRAGMLATGGVATGSLIYIILGFLGISMIVAQPVWLFNLLKLLGAVYESMPAVDAGSTIYLGRFW